MIKTKETVRDLLGLGPVNSVDHVTISVASPEAIRSWSKGEVKNPETINYRTFRPEKGGLFCERIFGPQKDWECSCGKYKRIKHRGVVCDRCGVEVVQSKVRRERMGHIELAVPISHIWFFKCMPSRIGLMLDMTARDLERVIYYEDYLVIDPMSTDLKKHQLLTVDEYQEAREEYGADAFVAEMGASAIRKALAQVDLRFETETMQQEMAKTGNKQTRKKLAKRIRIFQGFQDSHSKPEWMILTILPVIPPDLRPLVALEGGRFATSDLNDLYRRVINRNNRLKNLIGQKTPEVIIRNEKRMLQEAVDALYDNGRRGRAVSGGVGNRPLKSLSDILKGKSGRFRQNLLGKRVDYSGRSVIVIGPELKLHQCGLPKKMALVLFEPFIIRRLKEQGYAYTVRSAKKIIERQSPEVWDILEEVTNGHPVLLNRAPTLHRLSIQAFEPVLIEGEAIRLHPLVCTAFNADFDGDQMAVHVPLSVEAQMEARLLMMVPNNIFNPSNGRPIMTPTQDITLGCYYLTADEDVRNLKKRPSRHKLADYLKAKVNKEKANRLKLFASKEEAVFAFEDGALALHDWIELRNPDFGRETVFGDKERKTIETTVGRVIFSEIWPAELGFPNQVVDKGRLGDLIWHCYRKCGPRRTVEILDKLKEIGFREATRSGASIGIDDMISPGKKKQKITDAEKEVAKIERRYERGVITAGERYNQIIDAWTNCTDQIAEAMFDTLRRNQNKDEYNPICLMVDSGARGNRQQVRQLAGLRGLMAKPSGEIIERPIRANFREGLSVLEYFISTHGARKGLADTALKTADSGYMTRKLVDAAQDVIVREEDCGTINGIRVKAIYEREDEVVKLSERLIGRVSCDDVRAPDDQKNVLVEANQEITEELAEEIDDHGVEEVQIRSVLTCEGRAYFCRECSRKITREEREEKTAANEAGLCKDCYQAKEVEGKIPERSPFNIRDGVCRRCYGTNLATGELVKEGEAVGIIAAQSIGEPGTQLTMRTFHIGGVASVNFADPEIKAENPGKVVYKDIRKVDLEDGNSIVLNKHGSVAIVDEKGRELESYPAVVGAVISVRDGETVKKGKTFVQWDPDSVPILSEQPGKVEFEDIIEGVTMKQEVNEATGQEAMVIIDHKEDLHPQIKILNNKGEILANYSIPSGAHIVVKERKKIPAGALLAKTPRRKTSKTKDITGGLPRVAELFEARRPKDPAEISRIEGVVDFGPSVRGKRCVIIRDEDTGIEKKHLIPMGKHVIVFKGETVKKGQQLTEGPIVPHEMLEVCGPLELQEHLVNQVQEVYRLQGVTINDKHVEVIVRQMLQKVRIPDGKGEENPAGDTKFLPGEQVEKLKFEQENKRVQELGGKPAQGDPVLLGITKASVETESFLSAASFQDTTRVLTEAATLGKKDYLRGFKENVIMGHIIPAGTGYPEYRDVHVEYLADPSILEGQAEEEQEAFG